MMATMAPQLTRESLGVAVTEIRRKRANDPWDGPNGTARANQLAPAGTWRTWLILAGRGYGKTRTGAEWFRLEIQSGRILRGALVGSTASDVRDVMVEGESGLLACCDRAGFGATYNPSRRRVQFANGAVARKRVAHVRRLARAQPKAWAASVSDMPPATSTRPSARCRTRGSGSMRVR